MKAAPARMTLYARCGRRTSGGEEHGEFTRLGHAAHCAYCETGLVATQRAKRATGRTVLIMLIVPTRCLFHRRPP